ncbi:MAG: lipoprotein [Betaproteobacteria bacterium]|nr:lipoprotein [Betaproteobacteria bacterium]
MRRFSFLPALILILCSVPFTLAACGVKGSLKLPPPQTNAPAAKAVPAAPAPENSNPANPDAPGSAAADYHEPDKNP